MKPKDWMGNLRQRASEILNNRTENREQITTVNEYPPCFESSGHFKQWLHLAATSPPPARKDFPAEPNYCRDCNPEGQERMRAAGKCLFPMVRFQTIHDPDGDEEVVGYTPKRFLPRTPRGSYNHSAHHIGQGLYRTRWYVTANGSEQTKVVDLRAAKMFAERWGIRLNEEPAEDS